MDPSDPTRAQRRQPAPSEDPLIGRTIAGKFKVGPLIGEGGMASVYRATQAADPPDLAIKVMNAHLARDPTFVKRFSREAKAAARLNHRSTVRIFDYGVDEGLPYIAMELCDGAELVRILQHERRLSEARAARIMAQVCSALGSAHDLGIVHRDLKPENVMVLRDAKDPTQERVKVLDFGIAKIMERDMRPADPLTVDTDEEPPSSRSALTMAGTVVGTPEYMSPEQSRGGAIDTRSDIYACGVLLYQMVAGRVPFSGDTYFETALMHVRNDPPPPSSFTPKINPRLEALILTALAKDPADRPQTAREMQEALLDMLPDLADVRHVSVPAPRRPLESRPKAPEPAAGRPAQPIATPLPISVQPDSDDARTRVLPVARELAQSPISSEPPTLARPPTHPADGVPPTLADPLALDEEPPTVARPQLGMSAVGPAPAAMARPLGETRSPATVPGPPRRRRGTVSAAMALALGVGLGAAIIAVAILIAKLLR